MVKIEKGLWGEAGEIYFSRFRIVNNNGEQAMNTSTKNSKWKVTLSMSSKFQASYHIGENFRLSYLIVTHNAYDAAKLAIERFNETNVSKDMARYECNLEEVEELEWLS
jgi:hypothetical protein